MKNANESEVSELFPCAHAKAFRKTFTTNDGIVFVCEECSHHWFRTYAQINSALETEPSMNEPKFRATLEISATAYAEIANLLWSMGAEHCLVDEGGIVPFAFRFMPKVTANDGSGGA